MLVYQRVENDKKEVQTSDFLEQGQVWKPKTMDFIRTMYEIKESTLNVRGSSQSGRPNPYMIMYTQEVIHDS